VKHAWRYIAIGIAVYLPVLLVTFPVERLTGAVAQRVDGLTIQALTGSVLAGEAASLRYQGNEFGPVHWRFSPSGLLHGRLEYRLDLRNPDYHGHGRVGLATDGAIVGRDIELQLLPDSVLNAFSPMALSGSGQLRLQLDRFVLRDSQAQDVTGLLDWQAAELLAPLQLPLGDIQCALESTASGLVARLIRGGILGASGDITLAPEGRYMVQVLLAPGPEVSAETRSLLEAMLQPRPGGKFLISASGRL
jgi:general secretion pathway protein N